MPFNIADPERDMEKLVVRKASVFIDKNGINLLTNHKATSIDRIAKTVSGIANNNETFCFNYDKLLIATGASPVIPDLPGFNLPQVMVLKSLEQGKKIKSYIQQKNIKNAVIIGMGFIALEMCEAFEKRGVSVNMIKPGTAFLPWLKKELADIIYAELVEKNINIHTGHSINKIQPLDNSNLVQILCDNLTLKADMVLVASGVTPCSEMAQNAGLELEISKAIAVDKYLKTSDENIYAGGDCADAYHVVTQEKCWIPLALRANRAGWAVADNICGIKTPLQGVAGTSVFKIFSLEVARSGLNFKEAKDADFDPVENYIKTRSRAHGQPNSSPIYISMTADKKTGRLLGAQMVGKEGVAHRINAVAVALHNKMTVEDFFQTDLSYAPPFGPVWDPLLTAANQLMKKITKKV